MAHKPPPAGLPDDPLAGERFIRVVGKRRRPELAAPSAAARDAMTSLLEYRTRAPKGVLFYGSHEEANRDREKWLVQAMLEVDR